MDCKPKLLDQLRNALRVRHYSLSTEKSYVYWVRLYIRYFKLKHPATLTEQHVSQFLTFLAVQRQVSSKKILDKKYSSIRGWQKNVHKSMIQAGLLLRAQLSGASNCSV